MVLGKLANSHAKEWNWASILNYSQKLTRNVLKTLRTETIKFLGENIGGKSLVIIWGSHTTLYLKKTLK